MLFVGVGALCPAFIVSGGVGCSVVRGCMFNRFTVSRACGGVFGACGCTPVGDRQGAKPGEGVR